MSQKPRQDVTSVERLAAWSLSDDPIFRDPLAIRQARLVILDSIGCMVAARRVATAQKVVEYVAELGSKPVCTVFGSGLKTSPASAVLANGALVRALDLNDVMFIQKDGHLSVGGHCSDNVPVALAIAELAGCSWGAVFEAFVMGYEMFGRLRDVMQWSSNWDGASSSGLVAAAMTGRLMGFDQTTQAHALAFGATRCATPKIVRWGELSSVKNLANALIAESAVLGALLAARGLTGPREVLDHKGGVNQVFDPKLDFSQLWGAPTAPPRIMLANVKTYPCIGTAQTEIAAALDAHARLAGRINEIERIVVTMADVPMIRDQQAEESRRVPSTREEADHSFTFLPAIVLAEGELTDRQFADDRWAKPDMRDLAGKIDLKLSAELASRAPGSMPCEIKITLSSGEEIVCECLYEPGHSFPDRGLDQAVVETKFRECVGGLLGRELTDRVIGAIAEGKPDTRAAEILSLL